MTKTLSYTISTQGTAWSFVSGKLAALESELLPRSFFDGVLKAPNRAEARSALGKSGYRTLFPDDKSLDGASQIIDARGKEIRAEILKLCPPHPLENYFDIGSRFRTFRTLFNQMSRQSSPQVAELEKLFALFAVEEAFVDGMREHIDMLSRKNPPQAATPMERSLYLDSAACSLMLAVSRFAPEKLVAQYMADRAYLTAWSGIFRARWNGVAAEMIKAWFVFDNSLELATSVLAMEHEPKAEISRRLSAMSSAALESIELARIKEDIDAASADVLRETVLACRMVPAGPERVLSYLVAIEAELVNLDLSLNAIATGISREVTASRLRREYA